MNYNSDLYQKARKSADSSIEQPSNIEDGLQKTKPTENTFINSELDEERSFMNQRNKQKQKEYLKECEIKKKGRITTVYATLLPSQDSNIILPPISNNNMLKSNGDQKQQLGLMNARKSISNRLSAISFPQSFFQQSQQQQKAKKSILNLLPQTQESSNTVTADSLKQQYLKQQQEQQEKQKQVEENKLVFKISGSNTTKAAFLTQVNEEGGSSSNLLKKDLYSSPMHQLSIKHDEIGRVSQNGSQVMGSNQMKSIFGEDSRGGEPEYKPRKRDFSFRPIDRANLFEGLPFVQFENFVRKDKYMQKNIIRDLLKILGDKCFTFKSALFDRRKLKSTFHCIDFYSKIRLNVSIESLIGVIETIVLLIVHEFKFDELDKYGQDPSLLVQHYANDLVEDTEGFGIGQSPVQIYRDKEQQREKIERDQEVQKLQIQQQAQQQKQDELLKKKGFDVSQVGNKSQIKENKENQDTSEIENEYLIPKQRRRDIMLFIEDVRSIKEELQVLLDNVNLFDKMAEFMRDTIDVFRIMSRQRDYKIMGENQCYFLLKCITLARFQMGEIQESLRIYELNQNDLKQWVRLNQKKIPEQQNQYKDEEQVIKDEYRKKRERLQILLQNKFNVQKNRYQTRESKITLNDERFEQEKELMNEMNQDPSEKQIIPADNRKKIAIERLKNPYKDPDIAFAIKIARSVPNLALPKTLFSQ